MVSEEKGVKTTALTVVFFYEGEIVICINYPVIKILNTCVFFVYKMLAFCEFFQFAPGQVDISN